MRPLRGAFGFDRTAVQHADTTPPRHGQVPPLAATTVAAAAGQQQLHTAAAAAAPAARGGKRRAKAHTLMGTGEAQTEVISLRVQLTAATRKNETLERAAVQLKLKATELKRVQKEIAKLTKENEAVTESALYRAQCVFADFDFEGEFGPDFKDFQHFFTDLAESVLDGRCPIKSTPMLKMMTMAMNVRQTSTGRFRYPTALLELTSSMLMCDGAASAVSMGRGPLGTNKGKGTGQAFLGVMESRSNDPSVPSAERCRQYMRQNFNVPSEGVNHEQIDLMVKHLGESGFPVTPPTTPAPVETADWQVCSPPLPLRSLHFAPPLALRSLHLHSLWPMRSLHLHSLWPMRSLHLHPLCPCVRCICIPSGHAFAAFALPLYCVRCVCAPCASAFAAIAPPLRSLPFAPLYPCARCHFTPSPPASCRWPACSW